MIELNMTLNLHPISLNHYTKITTRGRFASKYKTSEAKNFEEKILIEMSKYSKQINDFNNFYNSKTHYICAEYIFYIPFFTKKNLIRKRRHDLDNFIKPVQDNIFKLIEADDSEIVSIYATKINCKTPKIKASYTVKDLTCIQ